MEGLPSRNPFWSMGVGAVLSLSFLYTRRPNDAGSPLTLFLWGDNNLEWDGVWSLFHS